MLRISNPRPGGWAIMCSHSSSNLVARIRLQLSQKPRRVLDPRGGARCLRLINRLSSASNSSRWFAIGSREGAQHSPREQGPGGFVALELRQGTVHKVCLLAPHS